MAKTSSKPQAKHLSLHADSGHVPGITGSAVPGTEGQTPVEGCRRLPGTGQQAELDRPSLDSVSMATPQMIMTLAVS